MVVTNKLQEYIPVFKRSLIFMTQIYLDMSGTKNHKKSEFKLTMISSTMVMNMLVSNQSSNQ